METFREIDALRLYGGDIRKRTDDGYLWVNSTDALYGDQDAYRTLNALLFQGIENEEERIWVEGHRLNPEFIRRIDETIKIYIDIFTLMKERRGEFDHQVMGKRVERASSISYYEKGFTQSFFSCSKGGYDDDFSQKDGIVLIEVELIQDVPFLDYEKILIRDEYKHQEEREILLPPFLQVELEKVPLTASETKSVKDQNNCSPLGKYQLKGTAFPDYRNSISDLEQTLWEQIIAGKEAAACLLEKMNDKEKKENYELYVIWKEQLHAYLKLRFSDIWYGGDTR